MSKYLDNVKKYVDAPNETAVSALVGHLGIALESHDSTLVAANDPAELDAIKQNYCSHTLDLTDQQADEAIAAAAEKMKGDHAKCRVTFYYLVAQEANAMHRLAG